MELSLLAGTAHPSLADAMARTLGVRPLARTIERFPDGELHVELGDTVRGSDVYVVQPTSPPGDEHLLELLFLVDACRRAGAARTTAVMPYFAYARQDRRAHGREALGARVVAELVRAVGVSRVVTVDLHAAALEGFFAVPLEHVSALRLLADAARPWAEDAVVVAPDLGAAKLADRFARRLELPVAVVHKQRRSGDQVSAQRITGDVHGKRPLVVDDMISTGGTIEAAVRAVVAAGALADATVVATHGLFVGPATARLRAVPVARFIVTDSVPGAEQRGLSAQVVSLSGLLAEVVRRLHDERSLAELLAHD
jgi:ribose-phosphate pyrophosphokinase